MARRRHKRRKNPVGEDIVVGALGAVMGAVITYFYVTNLPAPAAKLPATS